MNRLCLELEFLTPCFIAGAEQKTAELRSQSIKGVLRWWWRATVPSLGMSLEKMRECEALLFGSAESKIKSPVHVEVYDRGNLKVVDYGGAPWNCGKMVSSGRYKIDALQYLAYGPVATVGRQEKTPDGRAKDPKFNDSSGRARSGLVLKRPAIDAGQRFMVSLSWREGSIKAQLEKSLVRALAAWLTFGGLGSRSRKGWGSLDLVDLTGSSEDLKRNAKELMTEAKRSYLQPDNQLVRNLPAWPDVRYCWLLHKGRPCQDWKAALGEAGEAYAQIKGAIGKGHRWIFGDASPRRASSIFVAVRRDEGRRFISYIWGFPCTRGASQSNVDLNAWTSLNRIALTKRSSTGER